MLYCKPRLDCCSTWTTIPLVVTAGVQRAARVAELRGASRALAASHWCEWRSGSADAEAARRTRDRLLPARSAPAAQRAQLGGRRRQTRGAPGGSRSASGSPRPRRCVLYTRTVLWRAFFKYLFSNIVGLWWVPEVSKCVFWQILDLFNYLQSFLTAHTIRVLT